MRLLEQELRLLVTRLHKKIAKHFRIKLCPIVFFTPKEENEPFGWYERDPVVPNATRKIFIRLTDHYGNWLSVQEVMDTLAHEVAHSVDNEAFEHNRGWATLYHRISLFLLKHYY